MADGNGRRLRRRPQFSPLMCVDCFKEYVPTHNRQERCLPCRPVHIQRQGKLRSLRRRAASIHKIGATMACVRCGTEVLQTGGGQKYCRSCSRAILMERDRVLQRAKRALPESKIKERLRSAKRSGTEERHAYIREYERQRRGSDPKFVVHRRMKAMVGNAVRGLKAGRSWQNLVGYSCSDLMRHLERQFVKGMGWDNRSEWHIDHILPVSSFSFSTPEDPDFRACWALTNLRPLWSMANMHKKAKRLHLL